MTKIYEVPKDAAERALVTADQYTEMYQRSVDDNEGFWAEQGERIDWIKPFTNVKDVSFAKDDLHIRWYDDGTLNACYNCVDRHLETKGDDVAIIWEGDDPSVDLTITYAELHERVCKFANGLKAIGAKKGDRITIYMPMIPEVAVAMLACARIGAIHSVVFGGFSPEALAGRIEDCELEHRDHRRPGGARSQGDSAQRQCRPGLCSAKRYDPRESARREAHRCRYRLGGRPRRVAARNREYSRCRLSLRRNVCGRSAFYFVHVRLYR